MNDPANTEYQQLKQQFAKAYLKNQGDVGGDCKMLVDQISRTITLFSSPDLHKEWMRQVIKKTKQLWKDFGYG